MTAPGLVVLPEELYPPVIGNFPGHIVVGHIAYIGIPPAQRMDEGHGGEVLVGAGIYKAEAVHTPTGSCSRAASSSCCLARPRALASMSLIRFSWLILVAPGS